MSEATNATMAPWVRRQLQTLLRHRSHALLLQGPPGLMQHALGLALVQAWLCDAPTNAGACGHCTSCHGVQVHTHPDLAVLMPETLLFEHDWPLPEAAQRDLASNRRKPSSDIRVQSVRSIVDFVQRTSARGQGKAVLVYPAERMNAVSAAALLKTLEEPAGNTRFVLATGAAHLLLPTIRSRCAAHTMAWPQADEAAVWLQQNGVSADQATSLLRLYADRPESALQAANEGHDAAYWRGLVPAIQGGRSEPFDDLPLGQTVQIMQKICHDALAVSLGAPPRFLAREWLPARLASASVPALLRWWRSLSTAAQRVDHPLNRALTLDQLVITAQRALN